MLMLLLAGLWAGVQDRVTTYEDQLAADLVVVPRGTQSLFADPGVLPTSLLREIRRTEGVTGAWPIRTLYSILELEHGKAAVAAVAADPSAPAGFGGPWKLRDGRAPANRNELAVDALFADQHGLQLGDRIPVLGHRMQVVGLTEDTAMFMTPLLFTTEPAMRTMLTAPDTTGAILVRTDDPDAVRRILAATDAQVRTPTELAERSLEAATAIFGTPIRLMVGVALVAGTLIIALVAYTRVVEQTHDLGVIKALGATPARIRQIAIAQTLVLTLGGALTSVLLLLAARELLDWWRPAFPVLLTRNTVAVTAVAAAVMAALAAVLPARRLSRLDAASAFRSIR